MTERQRRILEKMMNLRPDSEVFAVGDNIGVNLDNPTDSERERRRLEVEKGQDLDDDCPLCQDMKDQGPFLFIFDEESMLQLTFSQAGTLEVLTGRPRQTQEGSRT